MRELQRICPKCLMLRYGQGPAKTIVPDTLKSAGWYVTVNPFKRTECDFCNHPFWFIWAREVSDTANHSDL